MIILGVILIFLVVLTFTGGIFFMYMKNPANLVKSGMAAVKSGNWNQAIKIYNSLLEKDTQDPEPYFYLGVSYIAKGLPDTAKKYLDHILDKALNNTIITDYMVYSRLAEIYSKKNDLDNALKTLFLMKTIKPQDAETLFKLGVIYFDRELYEKAIENFTECLNIDRAYHKADLYLGLSNFHKLKYKEALPHLLLAQEKLSGPETSKVPFYLGLIYAKSGNNKDALKYFQTALKEGFSQWQCYKGIGDALMQQAENQKAIEAYNSAIAAADFKDAKGDDIADLRYNLGSLYSRSGNIKSAFIHWKELAVTNPNYKDVAEKIKIFSEINKEDILSRFYSMPGAQFKEVCKNLVLGMGHEIRNIAMTPRDTIQIYSIYKENKQKMDALIEIGRFSSEVGELVMRDFAEKIVLDRIYKGIFITTSSFSKQAIALAGTRTIDLIYGDELKKLLKKINF
ncbi:MAG: hypothetical protein A2096_16360 [Spirochaetes bacterium GWF1_41_5]|nr:MAG: hypothetical protein A2096_16360 [Spirochaetes bacterium GWF1_41_5]